MAGRLAGSASHHARRRRRLAADEAQPEDGNAGTATGGDGKPLPARRPTGRFPLRRIVSRSPWKLAAVGLAALAACGAAVAVGHVPAVRSGAYGPGLAALCDVETGRLANGIGGLLLLATGQLAGLIRWARARSLRDFRGGYRVWWWTALGFVAAGVAVLTDAHLAFASTAAWLTSRTLFGSDVIYRFLPGLFALAVLSPALQRDMRGCRTSRTLVLTAAVLWLAGTGATLAPERTASFVLRSGLTLPSTAVSPGLLLAGAALAFTAMLFHARHVVYESVEPPEQPVRRKKVVEAAEPGDGSETKSKRATSSRSNRAKSAEEKPEPVKPTAEEAPAKTPRPHFVLKEQVLKEPPKPAPVAKPEPVAAKPQPKPEPVVAKPQPKPEPPKPVPVASKPAPPAPEEDSDDEDMAEIDGRKVRLDGPEDPLRGLSKRERRKLRKEMKQRDQ